MEILKIIWKFRLSLSLVIIFVLFNLGVIPREKEVGKTTVIERRVLITKSKIVVNEKAFNEKDSLLKISKGKIANLNGKISDLKVDADSATARYDRSQVHTEPCDSAIASLKALADTLDEEAMEYSHALFLSSQEVSIQKATIGLYKDIEKDQNQQIEELKKAIPRNWIERNGIYAGVISGILLTLLVVK